MRAGYSIFFFLPNFSLTTIPLLEGRQKRSPRERVKEMKGKKKYSFVAAQRKSLRGGEKKKKKY